MTSPFYWLISEKVSERFGMKQILTVAAFFALLMMAQGLRMQHEAKVKADRAPVLEALAIIEDVGPLRSPWTIAEREAYANSILLPAKDKLLSLSGHVDSRIGDKLKSIAASYKEAAIIIASERSLTKLDDSVALVASSASRAEREIRVASGTLPTDK